MKNNAKKNIVFDVGGVLIGYRWEDMLIKDYGLSPEKAFDVATSSFDSGYWPDFDAGLISLDELKELCNKKRPDISEEFNWFMDNSVLMREFRPRVYDCIRMLKDTGYNIYILSNYSEVLFKLHTDGASFWPYIDGVLVSYEVKLLKPDHRIYRALFDRFDLDPKQCLFFDDHQENIDAGEALGMDGIQVTDEHQLIAEIKRLI